MVRFLSTRLVIALCLLIALSIVTFVVYASIPIEPAGFLIDVQHAKPGQIAAAHHALGLDHSIYYRYFSYLAHLGRGDFGTAWSTLVVGYDGQIHGAPVGNLVWQAAGVTGSIILGGAVLLVVIAVPLALLSARLPRTILDRTIVAISLIGISTHPLVIGVVLRLLFAERWQWVPPTGYCNLQGAGPGPPPTFSSTPLQTPCG